MFLTSPFIDQAITLKCLAQGHDEWNRDVSPPMFRGLPLQQLQSVLPCPRDKSVMLNWRYRAEHCFSMVLIEVMFRATDGEPILPEGLELVLSEGDSFPVTSTCCPR